MEYCLNCGAEVHHKYCPHCGQKLTSHRLTVKILLEEVFHFFTHIEHTFLKTTFNFIIRPGVTSINYLEGKRRHYQKPVSFFLIWTAAYILLHNTIINSFDYKPDRVNAALPTSFEISNEFFREHFSAFFFPVLIISALIIYLVLAKPRISFIEVLVLCIYGAGCFNALLFLSDLVLGLIFKVNINTTPIFIYQTMVSCTYNLWFCFDFFKKQNLKWFIPRLILNAIIISLAGWVIFVYCPQWFLQVFH